MPDRELPNIAKNVLKNGIFSGNFLLFKLLGVPLPPTNHSSSNLPPIQRLLALHLLRAREKAGLSRAQMAQRMNFSPQEIENIEGGLSMPDIVELDV